MHSWYVCNNGEPWKLAQRKAFVRNANRALTATGTTAPVRSDTAPAPPLGRFFSAVVDYRRSGLLGDHRSSGCSTEAAGSVPWASSGAFGHRRIIVLLRASRPLPTAQTPGQHRPRMAPPANIGYDSTNMVVIDTAPRGLVGMLDGQRHHCLEVRLRSTAAVGQQATRNDPFPESLPGNHF